MSEANTSGITGLRTVAVPVIDQDRAVEFYVERLGFELRVDAPVEQLGETRIRFATGDAASLRQDLQKRNVDVGELLTWGDVPPMFTLRDPDGNKLVVVE